MDTVSPSMPEGFGFVCVNCRHMNGVFCSPPQAGTKCLGCGAPLSAEQAAAGSAYHPFFYQDVATPAQGQIENSIIQLLDALGFDLNNANFSDTPWRVARFYTEFIFQEEPEIRVFPSCSSNLIQLTGYEAWGLCPHHLLPVKYKVSVSYTPNGKVFGISKLPRIVDYQLRFLPLQEDLPKMICDHIHRLLDVKQVSCTVEGTHLCMVMRGVKAHSASLTTSYERMKDEAACE